MLGTSRRRNVVTPLRAELLKFILCLTSATCLAGGFAKVPQQQRPKPLVDETAPDRYLDHVKSIRLSSGPQWVAVKLTDSRYGGSEKRTASTDARPPKTDGHRKKLSSSATAPCKGQAALDEVDRAAVAAAMTKPANDEVDVQFLATQGCFESFFVQLNQLASQIKFIDRKLGFVHVAIPKARLLDALDLSGADYASVSLVQTRPDFAPIADPKPAPLPAFTISFPRVASDLPPGGPYFPAEEAGLNRLWEQYPQANGSGTHIAIVDGGLDLLHPALQRVKNQDQALLHKIADLDTANAVGDDSGWVRFWEPIQSVDRTITAANKMWKVPADGIYSLGVFARIFTVGSFVDPGAKKVTLTAGVLWDRKHDLVWVDTDGDGDFTNNLALSDYAKQQDIDFFGRVEGDQDNRIPFGVKIARAQNAVYISIGSDHATDVAGTAAANRLTGGLFDGAAPQAQIIDMRFNSLSTVLPALIKAASRPDVDVVNRSGGVGGPVLMEFERHVLKRLVELYKKPVVCVCTVPGTISVGDYQSPEMLRRNRQLQHPPFLESLFSPVWFTREGLENGIVAPSASLTTESRYQPLSYLGSDGLRHMSPGLLAPPAPTGYAIGANPSPTISLVSGIIADLIGLARQKNVRFDARRLANAVFTGASFVRGFPASIQGHGLIDALNAWHQLEAMSRADDPRNPVLTTFEVNRNVGGKKTVVYGYNEEFLTEGGTHTRELWVTRHGGFPGGRYFRLRLRGNDGTFALLETWAVLNRDRATRVRFTVGPTPGMHVAFLQLVDARVGVTMQHIPLEVRTPERPEVVAPGEERYRAEIPPRKRDIHFVHVDGGAQAMHVVMQKANVGFEILPYQMFWNRDRGVFLQLKRSSEQAQLPLDPAHHVGPMQRFEALVKDPSPGIWELYWDNRGGAEYETPYDPPAPDVPITGTLIVKKYRVSLSKISAHTIAAHNHLAAIDGRVEFFDGALATRDLEGTGARGIATVTTQVPPKTAMWHIVVESRADRTEDADVYIVRCTEESKCLAERQESLRKGRTTLSIVRPGAGMWRIVVMQRRAGPRETSYRLREALLTPSRPEGVEAPPFARHASRSHSSVSVPIQQSNLKSDHAIYAAFRIAPISGEKEGELIAVTPVVRGAP